METNDYSECPVCDRVFLISDIETHVNRCLFLNSTENESSKRKRNTSPSLLNKSGSSLGERCSVYDEKKRKISESNIMEATDDILEINSEASSESFELKIVNEDSSKNLHSEASSGNLSDLVKHLEEELLETPDDKIEKKDIHPFFTSSFHSNKGGAKKKTPNKFTQEKPESHYQKSSEKDEKKPLEKNNVNVKFSFVTPLAKQLQPKSLDDFVGQNHVFGENSILRTVLAKGEIPNMILWGPPGCGKTSLAGVVHDICKKESNRLRFVSMCAANAGVKDVQNVVTTAKNDLKYKRQTVLFMDEIHRFNKRQQDTFLIHVEKGEIILIGATTENPSFSINNALLSRCRVIVFEKLETEALVIILINAVNNLNIELIEDDDPMKYDCNKKITRLSIEKSALTWIADTSDGDARIALSNLQLVLQHNMNNICLLTIDDIKEEIKKSHLLYDRKGEEHYNLISAMHKSIRASDDNASLYWCTRMILSGEDPLYIARRLVRAASEDIGNKDPKALQLAISTMQGCQLLGMPECDVLLAQCAIYLARAPKSREADASLAKAKHFIQNFEGAQPSVPMHLRNAPTKLMKDLGYGKVKDGSSYHCMPEGCEDITFL